MDNEPTLVYIIYLNCRTMTEILGVYSSKEKAKQAQEEFCSCIGGASDVHRSISIIEKELL